MRIAILGWGSLLWCPRKLETVGEWQPDGPRLPIEFARISGEKATKLTLVLLEGVEPIKTYWIRSAKSRLDEARENLRVREGKGLDLGDIGYITRDACGWFVPFAQIERLLRDWLRRKAYLEAVIWTGLRSNFEEKCRKPFSVENAVAWLRDLIATNQQAKAEKYIRCAPPQTDTEVRRQVRKCFQWTDRVNCRSDDGEQSIRDR